MVRQLIFLSLLALFLALFTAVRISSAAGPAPRQGGSTQPSGLGPPKPPDPPREKTGMVPLPDLTGKYKGQDGGLYGGGSNIPPEAQMKAALAADAKIIPRDADGKPDPDGKIVLLSIGMSNTTMEFSNFKQLAEKSPVKNPKLVIIDGAQGAKDAVRWSDPKRRDPVWQVVEDRIKLGQVTDAQAQVVWIKQALMAPSQLGDFPKHSDALRDDLIQILQLARQRFPNLVLAYLSNRTYGGYATTSLNPEPYAYESAFADRGVIQMQISGDAGLSVADGKAPVVLWGPYLWTDGIAGRKTDDLVWTKQDVAPADGTHPSQSGQKKIGELLMKFFTTDVTAKGWFTNGDRGK